MITKDLEAFAGETWTAYKKPADIISRSDKAKPETALVKSDLEMFDFDKIVKCLLAHGQCKSADAFYAGKANAFGDEKDIQDKLPEKEREQTGFYLIEFKNYGPKPKERNKPATRCKYLRKKGFAGQVCPKDALKMAFYRELEPLDATECPIVRKLTGESRVCDKCSLLKEQRERRDKELTDSILLKAIEGYTILARTVFQRCADAAPRRLIYCVVIGRPFTAETTERLNVFRRDTARDDTAQDDAARDDTAQDDAALNARLKKLKEALNNRLTQVISDPKHPEVSPQPYLYDAVRVITPRRFEIQANQINVKKGT